MVRYYALFHLEVDEWMLFGSADGCGKREGTVIFGSKIVGCSPLKARMAVRSERTFRLELGLSLEGWDAVDAEEANADPASNTDTSFNTNVPTFTSTPIAPYCTAFFLNEEHSAYMLALGYLRVLFVDGHFLSSDHL
ncbi:hypothetical protein PILCRDRAFT_12262 [Piloderma croceum F 1598]|uniref:Uncharacterized protein n=1 Tax=Piloderma croceum (strain F 1598) TaxID=765440 RepID=A0A0C3FBJ5_PILCF|nr:hypothetical protein PILCRDRAFT_12262 [Piloderma croceum F 1598]